MTRQDPILTAALESAGQGLPVFFLGRTKRPVANCPDCPPGAHRAPDCRCGRPTCHGFYAATTHPDRVRALRHAVPRGLLALRTGVLAGLVVIDIDPRNGGALDPDIMPPTKCVATGQGGWHLYYRHPGTRVQCGELAGHPGVDIKADGGYVVLPPSVHPLTGRPYRHVGSCPVAEMPPPLITACRPAQAATPPIPTGVPGATAPTGQYGGGGITSPAALLAAHLDAVTRAPEGTRRTTLYGAARGVARMVAARAITAAEAWAALTEVGRAAEQTDRDIHAAILGGFTAEGVAA